MGVQQEFNSLISTCLFASSSHFDTNHEWRLVSVLHSKVVSHKARTSCAVLFCSSSLLDVELFSSPGSAALAESTTMLDSFLQRLVYLCSSTLSTYLPYLLIW